MQEDGRVRDLEVCDGYEEGGDYEEEGRERDQLTFTLFAPILAVVTGGDLHPLLDSQPICLQSTLPSPLSIPQSTLQGFST